MSMEGTSQSLKMCPGKLDVHHRPINDKKQESGHWPLHYNGIVLERSFSGYHFGPLSGAWRTDTEHVSVALTLLQSPLDVLGFARNMDRQNTAAYGRINREHRWVWGLQKHKTSAELYKTQLHTWGLLGIGGSGIKMWLRRKGGTRVFIHSEKYIVGLCWSGH